MSPNAHADVFPRAISDDFSNIVYKPDGAATAQNPIGVAAGKSAKVPTRYPQPNSVGMFSVFYLGGLFAIIVGWVIVKRTTAHFARKKELEARRAKAAAGKF